MPDEITAHADRIDTKLEPKRGWLAALKLAYGQAASDNIGIVAAGVAYYAFLAIVPLLGALVMAYGLIADPATVAEHTRGLAGALPEAAAEIITGQLEAAAKEATGVKGLGLIVALGIALIGARSGAIAVIKALNIAYNLSEDRAFLRQNLVAFALALGAAIGIGVMASAVAATGLLAGVVGKLAGYVAMFAFAAGGALLLYRFAPNRDPPNWRYQSPGAIFFAFTALVLTVFFGLYVANFASYNATYGSLGAVVVLLTWLYLTSYALLFGAEINAPAENSACR